MVWYFWCCEWLKRNLVDGILAGGKRMRIKEIAWITVYDEKDIRRMRKNSKRVRRIDEN